jgi:hypothetical protein
MAWTKSGLYGLTYRDSLNASQAAVNMVLTSHKWAMYNNTETPNFLTETAYSATNEASGTNYVAGGQVVGGTPTLVLAGATGILTYDMVDQVWASPTSVTAYGAKLYADALTTPVADALLVGMNFNGAFTSTAGTFTIQFDALGVFTITFAP